MSHERCGNLEQNIDYLRPSLIGVEARADLRRSSRVAPADVQAEIYTGWSPRPRDAHCLNLSQHGIALLCDLPNVSVGDSVMLNLWNGRHMLTGMTGRIARTEFTERFTKLGISFDSPYINDPDLLALINS